MADDVERERPKPAVETTAEKKERGPQRQITGNLPYTPAIGVFRRALEGIIESERPPNFNRDFMSTVLGVSGGAANPIVPIFKKVGLVSESGVPTDTYADFQTASGRANSALQALRQGFAEVFKRNQYAHKADREKVVDIIRQITGLPKSDPIIGYIYNTFNAFQVYAKEAVDSRQAVAEVLDPDPNGFDPRTYQPIRQNALSTSPELGISYHINIVLPETSNIDVLNAIFRSLKDNLLK